MVQVHHMVGTADLETGKMIYTNTAGNKYQVDYLQYYLSKLQLRHTNGTWTDLNNYNLLNSHKGKNLFTLSNVPFGTYDSLRINIGVDSAKNNSVDNTGDLDPVNGMFWPWNTSYIFYMFEGNFERTDSTVAGFAYHLGANDFLMSYAFGLKQPLVLNENAAAPSLNFRLDVNEIFDTPNPVDLKDPSIPLISHTIDNPVFCKELRDNLLDALTLEE